MKRRAQTIVGTGLAALAWGALVLTGVGLAAQDSPQAPASKPAVTAPAAEVHPPALGPREKSGVIVFLTWTWLTIGVLLYILSLKVREADRVHRTGLYEERAAAEKPPKRP